MKRSPNKNGVLARTNGPFPLAALVLLIAVTFISFYPSLNNGFVNLDDTEYVTGNNDITALSTDNLRALFSTPYVSMYIPVTMMTYAMEYRFAALDPRVYHATNLALHLLSCLLVFWLILLLGRDVPVSFLTALLFGIHPLHVESVAWISELKDVLCAVFFLASLIGYVYYRDRKRAAYYAVSLGCFVLALLSKPMAVSLPAVLILIDYLKEKRLTLSFAANKLPFFGFAACAVVVTLLTQGVHSGGINTFIPGKSIPFISARNLLFYLDKLVLPLRLSCYYPFPRSVSSWPLLLSPVAVLLLGWCVFRLSRNAPGVRFGASFFLVTLLPVLQFIPIGRATAADRYMYLPSIGLFYLCSIGMMHLWNEKARAHKTKRLLLTLAAGGIVILLSVKTWHQCQIWKDSLSLWNNVLANEPGESEAYQFRGDYFAFERIDYEKAIADYSRALERARFDRKAAILVNRAYAFMNLQRYPEAIMDYTERLALSRNDPDELGLCFTNRGNAYLLMKEYDKALTDFNQAIALNSYQLGAYYGRGTLYLDQNKRGQAIMDFEHILRIKPQDSIAYDNLQKAYSLKGN